MYKGLSKVMAIITYHKRKNIKKVVFTTNGQRLLKLAKEDWFTDVVDFVNLSRHSTSQEINNSIFKIKTIEWKAIKKISNTLAKEGIPLNINYVMSENLSITYDMNFVKEFVKIAKKNNVNSITLRKDYDDGFGVHPLEKLMGKPTSIGECPVCRKSRYIMNGMEVLFTTSEFEPTDTFGDNVYEFILQPNGDISSDLEGNDTIDMLDSVETIRRGRGTAPRPKKSKSVYMTSGCGSRVSSC